MKRMGLVAVTAVLILSGCAPSMPVLSTPVVRTKFVVVEKFEPRKWIRPGDSPGELEPERAKLAEKYRLGLGKQLEERGYVVALPSTLPDSGGEMRGVAIIKTIFTLRPSTPLRLGAVNFQVSVYQEGTKVMDLDGGIPTNMLRMRAGSDRAVKKATNLLAQLLDEQLRPTSGAAEAAPVKP